MRGMREGGEGDIMTLLSANQPLPCCCHGVTVRGVQGGTVLFKPTVNHNQRHHPLSADASSCAYILNNNNDNNDDNDRHKVLFI